MVWVCVTSSEKDTSFVMTASDKNYNVRYTFEPIDENTTQVEYYEWVEKGELEEPFTPDILLKLRRLLEE